MKDPELIAHQEWLGYLQPVGLVVSPPALAVAGAYPNKNIIVTEVGWPSNGAARRSPATGTIKRTDFGLTGMEWEPLVGDDVALIIEAMFERRKD